MIEKYCEVAAWYLVMHSKMTIALVVSIAIICLYFYKAYRDKVNCEIILPGEN